MKRLRSLKEIIDWQYWQGFLGLYMFAELGLCHFLRNTWRTNRRHSARKVIIVVAKEDTVAYLAAISNIRSGFVMYCAFARSMPYLNADKLRGNLAGKFGAATLAGPTLHVGRYGCPDVPNACFRAS